MKRLTMPCLLALLSVSMAVPACAGAYERCIKPVTSQITWSGSATELVDVVAQFLLCDGGTAAAAPPCALTSLEDLAAALGPSGRQVVDCLLTYHAANGATPKLRERARAVGAKRGVTMSALKCGGTVALRSPGEARPPAPPAFVSGAEVALASPGETPLRGERPTGAPGTTHISTSPLMLSSDVMSAAVLSSRDGYVGWMTISDGVVHLPPAPRPKTTLEEFMRDAEGPAMPVLPVNWVTHCEPSDAYGMQVCW